MELAYCSLGAFVYWGMAFVVGIAFIGFGVWMAVAALKRVRKVFSRKEDVER